ncbi:MAG: hypothetical protein ACRDUV_20510 [Pseudonocardiaceae bacterium]
MSNVWGTRHRLLREQLEQLADRLSGVEPLAPAIVEEKTVRLLAAPAMLLRQHNVNKRGQCKFCGWTRWRWRFWHRRPQCTVYEAVGFVTSQSLDVVWWQLFEAVGRETSLEQVQRWMEER